MRERARPVDRVFVYGSLRSNGDEAALLEPFAVRRERASARGRIDFDAAAFAVASFDPLASGSLEGELVWLDSARGAQALDALDRYEGPLFRRVTIRVEAGCRRVDAHAYEWLPAVDDSVREYLNAVKRKVSIARYHLERLRKEVTATPIAPDAPIPVQAHFEGVLYSAVAAADQLAAAINRAKALGLERRNLVEVLEHLDPAEPFHHPLTEWADEPIAQDARELRRRAVHHHYGKTPKGPTWVADSVDSAYAGDRDLVSYSESLVRHLRSLVPILPSLERSLRQRASDERYPA